MDAFGTQVSKKKALKDAKSDEMGMIFLSCDFVTDNWSDKLIESGMDAQLPTFVTLNMGGRDNVFEARSGSRNPIIGG